jgi:hypothetical protein
VIKYKPKEGCEDEFIEALRRLKNGPNQDKRGFRCIQLGTGAIAEIVNYESLENMMDLQINGLTWLDSVDCPSSYKMGHQSDLSSGGSGSFV